MALAYALVQFASWLFSTVIGVSVGLETMPIVTGCVTLMWLGLAMKADSIKLTGPNVLLAVFYALVTVGIVATSWVDGNQAWALTWTPQAIGSTLILAIALVQFFGRRRPRRSKSLRTAHR